MRWTGARAWMVAWLLAAACAPLGCGITQNPAYFPHLLPSGDVIPTHAKPPGPSYYADFDPYACRLEVRPVQTGVAVGSQQVLIATVYDNHGQPRRGRRVEWMLDGPGHIVEVDESGFAPGRGWKDGSRYAVSHTDYFEHTLTRGNDDPHDDFAIRPGQSWCVVSSPVEGDTVVTVVVPGIYNWDRRKTTATIHWINAAWTLPAPATARGGAAHPLTTNVYRLTDRMPVANYRVRYTVLEGPPAAFGPNGERVAETVTDSRGNATAPLTQIEPRAGVNRIGVEIIRPPDPHSPTGPGIIIGRGETFVEWAAPAITIAKVGPATAALGQQINYSITVTNTGRVETEAATVRDQIPDGLTFVGSQPQANLENRTLIWTLGSLPPGRSAIIQAAFRAEREGSYANTAEVATVEGLRAESRAVVVVAKPGLSLRIDAPRSVGVNTPIDFQVTVANTGAAAANNVILKATLDAGLEHETGQRELQLKLGTLPPGGRRTESLVVVPRQEGDLSVRIEASGEGGLAASAQHTVAVVRRRLILEPSGPAFKYATSVAEWNLHIANPTNAALANVVVHAALPGEVSFVDAGQGGRRTATAQGERIIWNLGPLRPREERRLQFSVRAEQVTPRALHRFAVTADGGFAEQAQANLEIRGVPALKLEAEDTIDPIEIGDTTEYRIRITNTGSLAARHSQIVAIVPPQMKIRRALGPDQTDAKVDDNKITFTPVDRLEPDQVLIYRIEVEAIQEGDARFRVQLRSDALGPDPVFEEESTVVTRPLGGNDPGPLFPPPP